MDAAGWLREQVEATVRTQQEVRQRTAALVATASQHALQAGKGMAEVVRASLDGARAALRTTEPLRRETLLRQVVDGIAEGLGTAAHAAELTLREARGDLARFAREDLAALTRSLQELGKQFSGLAADALADGSVLATEEAARLRDHVEATWRALAPRIDAVVDAAAAAPGTTVREALQEGGIAARGAASALFSELGRQLQSLGVALGEPRRRG